MREKADEIVYLIIKYFKDELSPEEREALDQWLSESEANRRFLRHLSDDHLIKEEMMHYAKINATYGRSRALQSTNAENPFFGRIRSLLFKRYIIAAAVLLLALLAVYHWVIAPEKNTRPVVVNRAEHPSQAIAPRNKASLTLADGSVIPLDDLKDSLLEQQGILKVHKYHNEIRYEVVSTVAGREVLYNTINSGLSEGCKVELPDGSTAWLNAGSSLRIVVSSQALLRHVAAIGESYYEVAKDTSKPFILSFLDSDSTEVEVLGTRFNTNAYPGRGDKKITVVEGRVKVSARNKVDGKRYFKTLNPNEQAQVNEQGVVALLKNVDVEPIIAWKEKRLVNASTGVALKQLASWYGLTVDPSARKLPDCLHSGTIETTTKIEDVLKVMEGDCPGLHLAYDPEKKIIKVLP